MSQLAKLIFVYNANSGKFNAFMDTLHKTLSPSTYQCKLCQITYGSMKEVPAWKEFRESFPGEMEFLHIDEFEKQYPDNKADYPVVFTEEEGKGLSILLSAEEMNKMDGLDSLITYFKNWANIH